MPGVKDTIKIKNPELGSVSEKCLNDLDLDKYPDETFVGRITTGFTFPGFMSRRGNHAHLAVSGAMSKLG